MQAIRKAAVAGQFYPDDPNTLGRDLQGMLSTIDEHIECSGMEGQTREPKALIVPHAGYIYSGQIAASAYRQLIPFAEHIKHVVLLGPAHRVGFEGLALSSAGLFETPLGQIPLSSDFHAKLRDFHNVSILDEAHRQEHSLEVQLPFLQMVLPDFDLLPIVVGDIEAKSVAKVLESLWQTPGILLVISSDLSHFLAYSQAQTVDQRTAEAVERLDYQSIRYHDACGRLPLQALLLVAASKQMEIRRLALANSGDTAGDKSRVVGYGAWALYA